jgi:hypothetical protein
MKVIKKAINKLINDVMPAEHLEKIGLENISNELMQAHD